MEAQAKTLHRSCSRSPLALRVVVLHADDKERTGTLRDISFGGAYLETDAVSFNANDVVTLCFELEEADSARAFALTGTVARLDPGGAGISFDEYDDANLAALRHVYRKLLV